MSIINNISTYFMERVKSTHRSRHSSLGHRSRHHPPSSSSPLPTYHRRRHHITMHDRHIAYAGMPFGRIYEGVSTFNRIYFIKRPSRQSGARLFTAPENERVNYSAISHHNLDEFRNEIEKGARIIVRNKVISLNI